MKEVFDVYSSKTKLYYYLHAAFLLPLVIGFIIWVYFGTEIPKVYASYMSTIILTSLFSGASYQILSGGNLVKMYKKDGELILSDDAIVVNSNHIPFISIKDVEINARDYRGARSSDGSGNEIKITTLADGTLTYRFVIESVTQKANLKMILDGWSVVGSFKVILNGNSLN